MKSLNAQSIDVQEEILSEIQGGVGWITLNRPKSLNALSLNMIRTLAQLLKEWKNDSSVKMIVLEGAGDKAFCAGGDVRAVYEAKKAGDFKTCDAFFREEYTLNTFIYHYPKPYISLLDGIAMGGGLGVSINGSLRIVTEKSLLAMPETGIGFFADVGATTFLKEIPGAVGLYLALTGTRLKAADAFWSGLATHFMASPSLPSFKQDLREGKDLEESLKGCTKQPSEESFLKSHLTQINRHFEKSSLQGIFISLEQESSSFAKETLKTLMTKSPTSLAVIFHQLTQAPPTFDERMKIEFRLSQRFVEGHDFMEGVRAVLVDKDQSPCWDPAYVKDIQEKTVNHYFSSLGERELVL